MPACIYITDPHRQVLQSEGDCQSKGTIRAYVGGKDN